MVVPPGDKLHEVGVVSCDIVGHSTAGQPDQVERVKAINALVANTIKRCPAGMVVWLSGGDGGHVVFGGDTWQIHAMPLLEQLSAWSQREEVQLRITGHAGSVVEIEGADGRVQVVGEGINFAGWLLEQVPPDVVVVSDAFRRSLAPVEGLIGEQHFRIHDERLFFARDGSSHLLYLMSLPSRTSSWDIDQSDYERFSSWCGCVGE